MSQKFTIKSVNMVGVWGYNISCSMCAICRFNLNISSLSDQDRGCDSTVDVGTCGHSYHSICISKWLATSSDITLCPICSHTWSVSKVLTNRF